MKVENRLPGLRAYVEHCTIAFLDAALTCYLGGSQMTTADQFSVLGRGFFQSPDVPLGNDQNMGGGLRINIFKCVNVLIFVNFPGWNFPAKDAAEKTIGHGDVQV